MKELLSAQLNLQDCGFETVTDLKIDVEHLKDDNLKLIRKIKDLEEEVTQISYTFKIYLTFSNQV